MISSERILFDVLRYIVRRIRQTQERRRLNIILNVVTNCKHQIRH